MARMNILNLSIPRVGLRTHEGAPARALAPEAQLRRAVMACMLWEDQFYEDGVEIAARIKQLVPKVSAAKVAALAVEAREKMKLRHAPLLLVREMARHASHRALVGETLARVIQRADEPAEFLALYWAEGKQPLASQVKKGLAAALTKFDAYQLAKYNRDAPVKLRDVLFLVHAKPRDIGQELVWKRLADQTLECPDTWEVALSKGADKRATFERLLLEDKLGALALLRNLRNMHQAGVREELVFDALERMRGARILPFQFLAAARHAPQWEPEIERAMLKSLAEVPKLPGKTVLLVDVSGGVPLRAPQRYAASPSRSARAGTALAPRFTRLAPLSRKSQMLRTDAAYGLAVLLREIAEQVSIYTFSEKLVQAPPRRGFALRDALDASQPHQGTYLGAALGEIREAYDRMVVITDEQAHDRVPGPRARGYVINVASYKNGVGYGPWMHIDGWSESVLEYIREVEGSAE